MRGYTVPLVSLLLLICGAGGSTARAEVWDYRPPPCETEGEYPTPASWLACHAPTFRIIGAENAYNRVGMPSLYAGWIFRVKARVDPETPAVFVERREDRIGDRDVAQLVYRVHFEKIPLRFSRYFFEAHRNPGILVMLTTDAKSGEILFVSAVHTCGCYLAVVPSDAVDPSWLPEDWPEEQTLYGQRLPGKLAASDLAEGLVITLASQSHRVTAIEAGPLEDTETERELPLVPMSQLEALPVEGREGQVASLYYGTWPLRGRVRGAWNAMEGLTLFGLLSLDPTVGMDKQFGNPAETGTRFYTQLPFWMHERSRLDRMGPLLRALGYRVPAE